MFLNDFIEDIQINDSRCFIIDSSSDGKHDDIDFERYSWNTRQNNKIRVGDWFIYRRSNKYSENHEFYFFGAGRFGNIVKQSNDTRKVVSRVEMPYVFSRRILKRDMDNYDWNFKRLSDSWRNSFTTYGITNIDKADFCNILNLQNDLADNNDILSVHEEPLVVELYKKQLMNNFYVDDTVKNINTRGAAQKLFADEVKFNYDYKCAITGISTGAFLVGSHIIPWARDKNYRTDPRNGICLSSLFDRAFDRGFISFDNSGKMLISDYVSLDRSLSYEINYYKNKRIPMGKSFSPKIEYLKYHRENIFKSNELL